MAKTAPTQNWPKLLGKIPRRFHRPEVLSWKKRSRLSRRMDGFDPHKLAFFGWQDPPTKKVVNRFRKKEIPPSWKMWWKLKLGMVMIPGSV